MQAGKLRYRVAIYDIPAQPDEAGEYASALNLDELTPRRSCRAKIEQLSGRELLNSGFTMAESIFKFTMRYPGFDVTQRMWLKYKNRLFDVVNVNNVEERDLELVLTVKERL